jgi:hypothetical protein
MFESFLIDANGDTTQFTAIMNLGRGSFTCNLWIKPNIFEFIEIKFRRLQTDIQTTAQHTNVIFIL